MSSKDAKFCKNCHWCINPPFCPDPEFARCTNPERSINTLDLVDGKRTSDRYISHYCMEERMQSGFCKPQGLFWEKKSYWWNRLVAWLMNGSKEVEKVSFENSNSF